MIAFGWIEWNWGEAILNESLRDVVNIVGFGLTFVGLAIAWRQLRKTQSAARAAEVAAREALAQSEFAYHKFTITLAHRLLKEAQIHVDYALKEAPAHGNHSAWEKVAIRLRDLTDQVNLLLGLDQGWADLIKELHDWNTTCDRRVMDKEARFSKKKWLDFCRRVEAKLSQMMSPFTARKGASNDLR